MTMQLQGHQKYRLGELLGAGGMAEVYRGEIVGAEGFSRPVAIKRVLAEHSKNDVFAEMFINEARISSLLSHPNVVSVIDFDRDAEGCLFLVMELVPGKDLNQLIKGGGPLPLPVVLHVTCDILRGLGYAHDLVHEGKHLGIVHRDVSPHNVLVSWDGAVKVSDFGIAKAAAATDATRSGMLKGKVAYMSPEQAHQVPLDGRSDLFAVGIMLYQMLVGQSPFEGGSIGEVLAHILVQTPQPPSELRPDLPADVEAVTLRLLEKDRDRRFPSAREAIAALSSCAAASPQAADQLVALLRERYPGEAPAIPTHAAAAATVLETPMVLGGGLTPPAATASAQRPAGGTAPLPGLQVTPTPTAAGEAAPVAAPRRSVARMVAVAGSVAVAVFAVLLVALGRGDDLPSPTSAVQPAAVAAGSDAGVPAAERDIDAGPAEAPPAQPAASPDAAPTSTPAERKNPHRSHRSSRKHRNNDAGVSRSSPSDWDVPIGTQDPGRVPVKKRGNP